MLDAGADVNARTKMTRAEKKERKRRSGADVNAKNINSKKVNGNTPLTYAALNGSPIDIVKLLLDAGADAKDELFNSILSRKPSLQKFVQEIVRKQMQKEKFLL